VKRNSSECAGGLLLHAASRPGHPSSIAPMKQSLECPRCKSKRIWVIDPFRIPGETERGKELPLVPHQGTGRMFERIAPKLQ
jgi:hypothetical protein